MSKIKIPLSLYERLTTYLQEIEQLESKFGIDNNITLQYSEAESLNQDLKSYYIKSENLRNARRQRRKAKKEPETIVLKVDIDSNDAHSEIQHLNSELDKLMYRFKSLSIGINVSNR